MADDSTSLEAWHCPGSGEKPVPGIWNKCTGCGRIRGVRNDGIIQVHNKPGEPIRPGALRRWRQMADDMLGVSTPDEVADYIRLSGLSIDLGDYGTWGQETLIALFAELGIQPGDDLQKAVERLANPETDA